MDSFKTIKLWSSAILLLLFNLISLSVSAKTYTIAADRSNALPEDVSNIFRDFMSKPEVVWGEVSDVDVKELAEADTLYCFFDDIQVELVATYYGDNNNSDYRYVHYESSNQEADAYVSIYDSYAHINLRTLNGMYHIVSISESKIAIVRYQPAILEESDYDSDITEDMVVPKNTIAGQNIEMTSTPTIRVLFLYTDSALTMMSGSPKETAMKEEAYRYINEGNQSFVNSNINARLQLAYVGPTNYDESSHTWNEALNHFYGQNDNYMDEVHSLRNKYAADICLLMLNKDAGYCGTAKDIRVDKTSAFAIIWPNFTYCGWRYSAIHEIGHLIGCRHNWQKDSTSVPSYFEYAHGYINCVTGNAWSTIMSYETSCDLYSPRKLYWSNPDVYYNGVATGTTTRENNARVWNERAMIVSIFRIPLYNINYTAASNNYEAIFESIKAVNQITTSGGYEIQPGQTVEMIAPTIRLSAGTTIKEGAKFIAQPNSSQNPYPQFITKNITGYSNSENDYTDSNYINTSSSATKILRDGHILIIRDNRTYTLTGQPVE